MQDWSLGQEDPLEKGIATHSSILAGKFLGQRSLESYSHGISESDTTELLTHYIMLHCIKSHGKRQQSRTAAHQDRNQAVFQKKNWEPWTKAKYYL